MLQMLCSRSFLPLILNKIVCGHIEITRHFQGNFQRRYCRRSVFPIRNGILLYACVLTHLVYCDFLFVTKPSNLIVQTQNIHISFLHLVVAHTSQMWYSLVTTQKKGHIYKVLHILKVHYFYFVKHFTCLDYYTFVK